MEFALTKIFWIVARPSTLLMLGCFFGSSLALVTDARWPRWIAFIAAGAMLLCGLLPVGAWLSGLLETRFERPVEAPEQVDGIIVLGGSEELKRTSVHGFPHLSQAGERLSEFVALSRHYPNAKLVHTGGYGFIGDAPILESDLARTFFESLGLAPERVIFERQSQNTRENAVYSKELAEPQPGETWLLVTSALHMPRSVGIFRTLDWPVVAWPVDYNHPSELASWPRFGLVFGLLEVDMAVREIIGLMYYRFRGWTDALFPSQQAP